VGVRELPQGHGKCPPERRHGTCLRRRRTLEPVLHPRPRRQPRRVTDSDSDWGIEHYRRCSDKLCGIRWSNRLPGLLPA
jgi:hypothetical protein